MCAHFPGHNSNQVCNKLILHGNASPSTGYYAEVGLLTYDAVRKVHSAVMKS